MVDSAHRDKALLLIEDDAALRESLRGWVGVMFPHLHLCAARDWSEGLAASRGRPPDVVLIDISYRGREGVEAVRRMRAAQPAAAIIALVGNEYAPYRQEVLASGAEASVTVWRVGTELLPKLEGVLAARSPEAADASPPRHSDRNEAWQVGG